MSLVPLMLPNYRTDQLLEKDNILNSMNNDGLICPFNNLLMGYCAE